jgi:hypothetical protein
MAIVVNLARPSEPADRPYTTPYRSNAGPPATSNYAGEIVYDSTAKTCIINVGSPAVPAWAPYNYGWRQL